MSPVTILIVADACPVKDEIYRVAERYKAEVRVVATPRSASPTARG